jgi:predicted PurR-regulated permease PerM
VLEERMAVAALSGANRLLFKRFGRTLLVWLLSIGVAIVLGIALACAFTVIFLPFGIFLAVAFSSGSVAAAPVAILAALVLFPLSLLVAGFVSAQSSTYWTVAFRRLDLDQPPTTYQYPPQAPPPPMVTS